MPKSKQMYLLTFKIIKLHTYKPIKMKNIYTQLDTKFLHLTTKIAPSFQFIPYKMHILTNFNYNTQLLPRAISRDFVQSRWDKALFWPKGPPSL